MHSANRKESRNQTLPLRPLVQVFLDKLAEVQWTELESSSIDSTIEDVLRLWSFNVIFTTDIFETFERSQSEGCDLHFIQSSSKPSTKNVTAYEKRIRKHLGDHMSLTFAELKNVLEYVHCRSSEDVTEELMKEITRWINSELYKSCESSRSSSENSSEETKHLVSKSSTFRQKLQIHHMVETLKNCATVMASETLHDDKKYPEKEAQETSQTSQTLVTPLEEDKPENTDTDERVILKTAVAIRKILTRDTNRITDFDSNDDIRINDDKVLIFSIQKDIEKATFEILRLILDELKLKTDGTPEEESEPVDKTSLWKRVEREIKIFFVQKFVKESIICLVVKLRIKFDCFPPQEEKRLSALLEEVDWLLENMIALEEYMETKEGTDQGCLFKKITYDSSSCQRSITAKRLCDRVNRYLQPSPPKPQHMEEIRTEVDIFMELMSNWLKQQAEQHERKTDKVSAALRKIKIVAGNLPALSENPLEMKGDTSTSAVTEEPAVRDETDEAQPDQEWDEACQLMVTMLVEKIIKDSTISLCRNNTLLIIMTLKKMLLAEIAGCDAVIKPNPDDIQQIVKAVKKNLYEMMGGPRKMFIKLQAKKSWLYECIISSLKEHLTTPQRKTGIKQFFKSLFRFRSGTKE
uniref:uncharacterized protein LOC124074835 n=1 Tax=Scatophagus argus TaxID=75038 RepID=UPI001ED7D3E7|nr:uncharacterized protein LOC124074835 [Scatophagus argus]